jgi:hypothetical protein
LMEAWRQFPSLHHVVHTEIKINIKFLKLHIREIYFK